MDVQLSNVKSESHMQQLKLTIKSVGGSPHDFAPSIMRCLRRTSHLSETCFDVPLHPRQKWVEHGTWVSHGNLYYGWVEENPPLLRNNKPQLLSLHRSAPLLLTEKPCENSPGPRGVANSKAFSSSGGWSLGHEDRYPLRNDLKNTTGLGCRCTICSIFLIEVFLCNINQRRIHWKVVWKKYKILQDVFENL